MSHEKDAVPQERVHVHVHVQVQVQKRGKETFGIDGEYGIAFVVAIYFPRGEL
jgi:hypothetical protein